MHACKVVQQVARERRVMLTKSGTGENGDQERNATRG